ncbi:2-succinyl-5-enolpyruvyl-6-hydroxy-3-cyclohexene-1-carboxylic-acid synthase [Azospira restricta]|uniref:2-succinyl-5-enolpyruvyl-6-hydroxy-3-cyclohexene-1-carboxylate synthase n=1 Tax=Azospira restricta TaxID=404405 RepID=A0A974SN51_9RHOO|nr:2-succinyl-5-enolpyruvyl-6-hydroxy-3-cyclohexene-1-carboxylic-acid synthase [Azospira restricta]QRJ62333.1 2-succinyl-5-enolpyruvyl-6-hydroxy-3-cyclohexene-1-carboxylic-acid synthase [Azospira restricta]
MQDTGQLNLDWSAALIGGLADAGVREFVLSPGARSTPLTLAALRHPRLRCTVILDERAAAWFALGRVKADGAPVALVCTSGTAVANWLPAVVEANQAALPLVLLAADRPPELHGWGANQTIAQADLFAGQVRATHAPGAPFPGFAPDWLRQLAARAVADSRWPLPGPVQLNLAFREPLLPAAAHIAFPDAEPLACAAPTAQPDAAAVRVFAAALSTGRGAIVCGEGCAGDADPAEFARAVTELAARLACPILAEPLSGLRFGAHDRTQVCHRHDLWLRDETRAAALRPDWVLRFGAFPVTRMLQRFVAGAATLLVEPHGRWPDPLHRTQQLLRADPLAACRALFGGELVAADAGWLAAFAEAEAAAEGWLHARPQPPEAALFAGLCRALPAGTHFFCGNSLPIRDLAAYSGSGEKAIAFFANRGASGIDGNLATAAGLAASGPTVAVVGDLTAQHDLGSLALAAGRPLAVIVINNGGGGIFDLLPPAALPEFEAGWLTPQRLDFAHTAAAFGLAYRRCDDPAAAIDAAGAALAAGEPRLIEFVVDRAASLALRRAIPPGG